MEVLLDFSKPLDVSTLDQVVQLVYTGTAEQIQQAQGTLTQLQERIAGESKLSMKQNVLYVRQLASLYVFKFGLLSSCTVFAVLVAVALYIMQMLVRALL